MAYIGEKPSQTLASPTSQYFNGDGSTVAFTLNRPVNVAEELEVFVNNIQQEPGVGKSYTATGTTLTFDAAPSAGTANVYVVYRGLAEVTTRLEHDPNAALAATTGTFSGDLTVDTNTLYVDSTNNRVGIGSTSPDSPLEISNSASGTADAIELANFSGNSSYIKAKRGLTLSADYDNNSGGSQSYIAFETDAAERMRIDNSGRVTMPYQPSFEAYKTSSTTATGIIVFDTTNHNIGNHYNTSTGRFTAPVTGTYLIISQIFVSGTSSGTARQDIRLNGSNIVEGKFYYSPSDYEHNTLSRVLKLSANDYVEVHLITLPSSGGNSLGGRPFTSFSGYLIG